MCPIKECSVFHWPSPVAVCGELRPRGGGQVATLNVCNPHKEIVSGRSSLVNSFLAVSPVLIPPPKGEL